MKKTLFIFGTICLLLWNNHVFSQKTFNPSTGDYGFSAQNKTEPIVGNEPLKMPLEIPCNPNTFWACDISGSMVEYELIGTTISNTGISYAIGSTYSATYANYNNGPTFFSTEYILGNTLFARDNNSWVSVYNNTNIKMYNGGGSGDHIYVGGYPLAASGQVTRLYHYSQGNLDTAYVCNAGYPMCVADQPADAAGNAYIFTGISSPTLIAVDTLVVVSPAGVVLNKYPVAFNSLNAYGAFIFGNTIYVGLGAGNTVYPETLLPVIINGSTATVGTPIPFPGSGSYFDLESCNQGFPLSLFETGDQTAQLNIYPVPATNDVTISFPKNISNATFNIYNSLGKLIGSYPINSFSGKQQFNVEKLETGIYFVELFSNGKNFRAKMQVLH